MIYYVDGWQMSKNPSPGGGFTVVNEHGDLVKRHSMFVDGFTNNHAELLAVAYAAFIAAPGDTIITDSQTAFYWTRDGKSGPRRDLKHIAVKAHRWIRQKRLTVEWQPRADNLAGQYNESASTT